MRFLFFWLIRFGGGGLGFLLGAVVALSASIGLVDAVLSGRPHFLDCGRHQDGVSTRLRRPRRPGR
jgi:hypothetical protein